MGSTIVVNWIALLRLSILTTTYALGDPNVRVEFELKKLTNAKGAIQAGGKCSLVGKSCSQRLSGYVDTSATILGWPGSKKLDTWPEIIKGKDNVVTINKVLSGDFCSGQFKEAIFRAHVVDTGLKDRLLDDFECKSGTTVAPSEAKAAWSPEMDCVSKYDGLSNKLTYRVRAYKLGTDSCGRPSSRPH